MRITGITTRIVRQSSELWYGEGRVPEGYTPWFDFPLTTLHTDEPGIEGHTSDYCPLGQGPGSARAVHDVYFHDLVGKDPLHHEAIWQAIRAKQRHLYNFREAIWGNLDVALWDIKGKVAGQSIATMLGRFRDRVPLYSSLPPQTIRKEADLERELRLRVEQGFRGVKLQLYGASAADVAKLRLAREVVGDGFPLMVDCCAELGLAQALAVGRVLDELDYEWFEEPLPDANIAQLKALSDAISTPVLAAETVGLFEMPNYMVGGAVDIMRGDVHHKGGVTGLMKAMGLCEAMGFELEIHTAGSPFLDLANLHVGCATRLSRFLESHHPMFRFGLKGDPLGIREDGCQHVPTGPGLGADIDWDWIDDHTVEVLEGYGF